MGFVLIIKEGLIILLEALRDLSSLSLLLANTSSGPGIDTSLTDALFLQPTKASSGLSFQHWGKVSMIGEKFG